MIRHRILAVLVVTTLALTGCAGSKRAVTVGDAAQSTDIAAPVEQGSRRVLTTAQATSALPTSEQVGADWAVGKTGGDSTPDTDSATFTPEQCAFSSSNGSLAGLAIVDKSVSPVATAQGDFNIPPADGDSMGLNVHSTSVSISSYEKDIDTSGITAIATRLEDCAKFTSTSADGLTASFDIFPVSLPNYGDETLAFAYKGP